MLCLHVLYCSGRGCFTLCLFVRFGRQPDQVLMHRYREIILMHPISLLFQIYASFVHTHMLHASLALSIHTALFVH